MKLVCRIATVVSAFAQLTVEPPSSALAQETSLSPEVEYALAVEPGGIALDHWTAVWPETRMRLDVERSLAPRAAVRACPNGYICAFNAAATAGSKLS